MAKTQRVGHCQFVADLVDVCSSVIRDRCGIPRVRSSQLMEAVAESFCLAHGRRLVHVSHLKPDAIAAAAATPGRSDARRLRWHVTGFVFELVRVGAESLDAALRPAGCDPRETMVAVAGDFVRRNAGCVVYIPAASYFALRRRNAAINEQYSQDSPEADGPRKFTAARADELAVSHGLSMAQLYNIIKSVRDDARRAT